MIEAMKKITLILFFREKKKKLAALQQLGLVHLETRENVATNKYKNKVKLIRRYEAQIRKLESIKLPVEFNDASPPFPDNIKSPRDRLHYIEDLFSLKEKHEASLDELHEDYRTLLPWGRFTQERLDDLVYRGLRLRFFIGAAPVFDDYDFSEHSVAEVNRLEGQVYFTLLEYKTDPVSLPFEETILPRRNLKELKDVIEIIKEHHSENLLLIQNVSRQIPFLQKEIRKESNRSRFEEAKINLKSRNENVLYTITGWFPVNREQEIRKSLEGSHMAYFIEEPSEEDTVPVKLKNPPGSGLFEPITRIFSLPHYFELDPTPFFAPFFALFFGLCLGDLGYGLLLALGSLGGVLFAPKKFRPILYLGLILSLATAMGGVFLNSFFGHPIFALPGSEQALFETGGRMALFAPYKSEGGVVFPAMTLSLLLGVVQLCTGILLRAFNEARRNGFPFAVQPLCTLLLIIGGLMSAVHMDPLGLGFNAGFKVGPMQIGALLIQVPKNLSLFLVIAGLLGFFLFNNPDRKFFLRPALGLWEFYQFTTGLLGDFLSYIRLFALGLASGLLGNAFNQIAFGLLPRENGEIQFASPVLIFVILILILGHTLNLGLSALGAFVHPLRLTFVEFYKNLNFKGGGVLFRPFNIEK